MESLKRQVRHVPGWVSWAVFGKLGVVSFESPPGDLARFGALACHSPVLPAGATEVESVPLVDCTFLEGACYLSRRYDVGSEVGKRWRASGPPDGRDDLIVWQTLADHYAAMFDAPGVRLSPSEVEVRSTLADA
jgi:hypothetical protein